MKQLLPICAVLAIGFSRLCAGRLHAPTSRLGMPAQNAALAGLASPGDRQAGGPGERSRAYRSRSAAGDVRHLPLRAPAQRFPKAQEAAIRQGALEMIIFEELVYQEAERRKLTISEEDQTGRG